MSNDDKQYSIAIFPRPPAPSWENNLPTSDSETQSNVAPGDLELFSRPELRVNTSTSCSVSSSPDPSAISQEDDEAIRPWWERQCVNFGILALDLRIPTVLMNTLQARYREYGYEFTHPRYTAATCDPDDFTIDNGYILRPVMLRRHTELLVGITYYNEDKSLFSRTLHNIMINVRDIVNQKKSEFWNSGRPAWEKIVVCILIDGIDPCDKNVLDVLTTLGIYQEGIMKNNVNMRPVIAHIFELTTQMSITADQQLIPPGEGELDSFPPVQLMLCIKQKNSKKINSHRWLFNAFGRILNPEVVVCLDAGTRPEQNSLLHLWSAFHNDPNLGGCCGEIHAMTGPGLSYVFKPLIASQRFEYKMASILDQAMETAFGYVTVLPGAFSAYRFSAVKGRPLEQYFHGDFTLAERLGKKGVNGMNSFVRNLFLADDRILSFELVMKKGARWHTSYVKQAKAETDIPEDVIDFIDQRRRWINGAFAAACYSIVNFWQIYKSDHSIFRMALLHIQLVYNVVALLLSWFGIAGFLLTTFIITDIAGSPPPGTHTRAFPFGVATPTINAIMQLVYMMTIILQFVLALGNKARCERWAYVTSFTIFGVVQLYFVMNVLYLMIHVFKMGAFDDTAGGDYNYIQSFYASVGRWTVLITCGTVFGVYYAASFLHLDPWHMFDSYAQYLFVVSSYTNILDVYAFSNWHDVSWGEKRGRPLLEAEYGSASTAINGAGIRIEMPSMILPIDEAFAASIKRALAPYKKEKFKHSAPSVEESFKLFRTRLVAAYIFSNFLLCAFIINGSIDNLNFLGSSFTRKVWFFRIWLWATAATFTVRFVGSCCFLMMSGVRLCFARR